MADQQGFLLQQSEDWHTAEELRRECDALKARIAELEEYTNRLIEGLDPLSSKACVLCKYEDGAFIEPCAVHASLQSAWACADASNGILVGKEEESNAVPATKAPDA